MNGSYSQRRWLVTGAAGFIGSHLVERLVTLGQQVAGIDNFSTGKQANLDAVQRQVSDESWSLFSFVKQDIRDREAVIRMVEEFKPDVILHQAALGSVPRSIADPTASHESNVDGFINMLEAARKAGTKRFVYASSSSVYGDIEDSPKVESRLGELLSPYAATKRINEVYAQVFGRTYEMETVGLRYFNVFGPRQDPAGQYAAVIPRWLAAVSALQPATVYGDGSTSRDFCYVANVVQANILAGTVDAGNSVINSVVNIACGATTSLMELFELIRDEVARQKGLDVQTIPAPQQEPFRKGDILHSKADISFAKEALGYHPSHTVEEGIVELVRASL
jgi:UDP-N-acetylglucosamine 4-epimerase